jgi:flagellin-like protein
MELDRSKSKKRRAISGIIAAVILFAMLFTVGTSYFLFVNSNNLLYSKASVASANALQGRLSENVLLTASAPNNKIAFTVNNIGGLAVNVTAVYVTNSTGYILAFFKIGTPGITPTLPIAVNIGTVSSVINTGVSYTSGKNYVIKILTQRGSTFSTTYPPTATTLAAQALSSGAIGDLYLNFHSYTYYDLTTTSCPTAGTQLGTTGMLSSGVCFSSTTGNSAFVIPHADANNIGFSVQVTDLNNQSYDIILDQFSLLYQVLQGPNAKGTYYAWYIASVVNYNGQDVVTQQFSPYVLTYNNPTTVYFVGSRCISANSGPTSNTCVPMSSSNIQTSPCNQLGNACTSAGGYVSTVFIISHGWEQLPPVNVASLTYTTSNYGQNSPYVSSLYY